MLSYQHSDYHYCQHSPYCDTTSATIIIITLVTILPGMALVIQYGTIIVINTLMTDITLSKMGQPAPSFFYYTNNPTMS